MSKTINVRELRKRCQLDGGAATVSHITEALQSGALVPEDFSFRDIAEAMLPDGAAMLEDGAVLNEDVAVTAVNTIGAVIETKIKEAYRHESFAASKLVKTIPTRYDGEKIYQFGSIDDSSLEVGVNSPYPAHNFDADYIETPGTSKRGLIVPVTRETVFFDRTHQVLERAAEVGEVLAMSKEKRILEMILGLTNSYKYNGAAKNTYYSGAAGEPWKNLLSDNELQNWTDIEAAEDLFGAMTDPVNGHPVLIEADNVLVMPAKRHLAHRLFYASSVSYEDDTTSTTTAIRNPFAKYKLVSSRLGYQLLKSVTPTITNPEKIWVIGNFKKAFAYMENWGITVTRSGSGSEADFTRDVIVRFKASERGVPAVLDPRYAVKCTG
ncbi:hypothetical protein FACS1894170_01940 [Planctomycetales bacterium]|nr:hypothetical protein FACS1894170_01940 [Planctomycetales bacterium]